MRRILCLFFMCVATCSIVSAQTWKSKPFTGWSAADVERLQTDSPWAKTVILRTATMTGRGGLQAVNDAQMEPNITYAISIRSALPVRQANVRMHAITDRYDKLDPAGKQAFDAKWNAYLATKFPETVVVGVIFQSNVPGIDQQLSTFFQRQTLDDMKGAAALILSDGKRLQPLAFVAGAHEMQMAFPRPELQPGMTFNVEFKHPDMPDQPSRVINQKFAVKDMVFNGAPAY